MTNQPISGSVASLRVPKFGPATKTMLLHVAIVFAAAFGGQLVAGATNVVSIPTLFALLYSAAAAGLIAIAHYVLGLIPTPPAPGRQNADGSWSISGGGSAVPSLIEKRLYQFLVSVVVTFLSIFGAALVAGTVHVTSLPSGIDAIVAAISAAVAGVVQVLAGLIPAPK
jgi:hypothetical protein